MAKLSLSVCFISFNEEANMERTLKSVADIASEIIVVDSHSTDKTVEIAEKIRRKGLQRRLERLREAEKLRSGKMHTAVDTFP
ncbi:MAG: glycosyltransferase [Geovibrio sp.]|nr:glycosyltransferase [Geovibrio sp.]